MLSLLITLIEESKEDRGVRRWEVQIGMITKKDEVRKRRSGKCKRVNREGTRTDANDFWEAGGLGVCGL